MPLAPRLPVPRSLALARRALCAIVSTALATTPALAQTAGVSATPVPAAPASGVFGTVPPSPTPLGGPSRAANLPDLGDSAQAMLSPAQERKIGETALKQLRAAGGYLNDPEVNDYLNELGQRLVAVRNDSRFEFLFFAVPDPSINAFAMPGGFIGVNTGLILLTQSESELASVLAHEITHVTQNHIARMLESQKTSLLMSLAALAVALIAARSNSSASGDMVGAAITSAQALSIQNQLNFTRENEYEADRIGFDRLDAAGFDVGGAATLMERLQKASRFADGSVPTYLRTHPVTYERIAEAQARAQNKPYRQVADSPDFQMVRALLRSYMGRPDEAVAWFDAALADRKFNNEVAVRYGLVASLLRDGQLARAKRELAALERIAPPHPMIEAIAGHVLQESGDTKAAVARFASALARYPTKMQLVYDYPEALLADGRAADATVFTEAQLARFPQDGTLHRIAAKAYAAQGKQLKQHQHQGEYYAWQGNLRLAIDQLELAIKAGDANFYESSVVEARLRALKREQDEQKKEAFARGPG
ncbi:MAG TPA: M48 family metalloprotease [Casimicrobiaceae bacterium]|nr:M48 family metalloprotease [Casimicrobiaceae bacterium]